MCADTESNRRLGVFRFGMRQIILLRLACGLWRRVRTVGNERPRARPLDLHIGEHTVPARTARSHHHLVVAPVDGRPNFGGCLQGYPDDKQRNDGRYVVCLFLLVSTSPNG